MRSIPIDLPARVVLFPLLAGQAVYTAKRSLKLPEADGPRRGVAGTGTRALRLLVMGDSSAAGVGVAHQDQALMGRILAQLGADFRIDYTLIARTGATTADTINRLARQATGPFDVAVVCLGVNDVTSGMTRTKWAAQTKQLIAELTRTYGVRQICLTGLPPVSRFPLLPQPLRWIVGRQAARFDRVSARIAGGRKNVDRIAFDMPLDPEMMAADGFHPGPEIYNRWAQLCCNRIRDRFGGGADWISQG